MLEKVYEGLNAQKCIWRLKCSTQSVFIERVFLRNVPDLRVFQALRVYLSLLLDVKFGFKILVQFILKKENIPGVKMWKCIYCGPKLSSCKLFTVNFFRAKMFNWKWRRHFSFESLFPMGLCFWKRYQLCSHPSEILVSELRSKSEWERFPPALKISSFQREYLKIPTW